MGKTYVDKAFVANDNDFGRPVQQFVTEHGCSAVWCREAFAEDAAC